MLGTRICMYFALGMAANGPILTDYYMNSLIQRGDIFSGTFFIPNFGQREERKFFERRIGVWWNSQVICISSFLFYSKSFRLVVFAQL